MIKNQDLSLHLANSDALSLQKKASKNRKGYTGLLLSHMLMYRIFVIMKIFSPNSAKVKIAILLLSLGASTHVKGTDNGSNQKENSTSIFFSWIRGLINMATENVTNIDLEVNNETKTFKQVLEENVGKFDQSINEFTEMAELIKDFKNRADKTLASADILIQLMTYAIGVWFIKQIYRFGMFVGHRLKEAKKKRILKRKMLNFGTRPQKRHHTPHNAEVNV